MDLPGDPKLWPDDPLDRGLAGEWRFDRNTGLMVPDYNWRGNHGTVISDAGTDAYWTTTKYGPGLWNTDTTDENAVNVGNSDFETLPLCCEMFLYYYINAGSGYFFSKRLGGNTSWYFLQQGSYALNLLTPTDSITASNILMSSGYYHVMGVIDSAGEGYIYVNAEQVVTGTVGAPTSQSAVDVLLGARGNTSNFDPIYPLSGIILDARIYNRVPSAPEVRQRYQICMARASGAKSLWMIPFVIEDVGVVTYTATAAAQAVLKMAATATAAGQAVLKEAYSKTAAGQAWVQDRTTNTAAGQAILKELYSKTAAAQAWLQDRVTSTAAGQAFLQMTATATAAGQAVLKMSASATAAGKAVLKEAYSKTAAGQAYLVDIGADKTAAMKAILKEAYSKTAAAQAWLQDRITTSAAGQAVLKEAVGATNALQAYLIDVGVGSGIAAMKATLKEAYSKSAAAQAILKMAASATSAIQAYLQDRSTLSAAIRAIIKGTMTPIAAMQAYLSGVVVKVDFTLEPRPTVLELRQRPTTLEVEPRPDILYIEER